MIGARVPRSVAVVIPAQPRTECSLELVRHAERGAFAPLLTCDGKGPRTGPWSSPARCRVNHDAACATLDAMPYAPLDRAYRWDARSGTFIRWHRFAPVPVTCGGAK